MKSDINLRHFYELDSTNSYLKSHMNEFPHKTIVVADQQTNGRGRGSNRWLSSNTNNLYMSILLKGPNLTAHHLSGLTEFLALIAADTIDHIDPLSIFKTQIKWPNDLMIDDKKICGILTESGNLENQVKRFYIGIGLNVNQEKFTDDIKNNVTSLKNITGINFDRYELLYKLAEKIVLYKDAVYLPDRILYLWKLHSGFIGRVMRFRQTSGTEIILGKAIDVSDDGALIIENVKGEKVSHYSGEISFIF